MKKIKPKDPQYLKEKYFNFVAILVFLGLLILNLFDIVVLTSNKNIQTLYLILLIALIAVFTVRTILNLFYKIEISEDIITFHTPFNLYRKRVAFSTIADFRFRRNKNIDDTLVLFLTSEEVVSIGIKRYSAEQKEYLKKLINERSNIIKIRAR